MKIMQVIPSFHLAGAETMCQNLCVALKDRGHEVLAVSLYTEITPLTRRLEAAGVRVVYLDKSLGFDGFTFHKLVRLIRAERPDVVHTHLYASRYAQPAAILCGVPRRVHTIHSVAQKETTRLGKWVNWALFRLFGVIPVALSEQVRATVRAVYGCKDDRIPVAPNGVDLSACVPKEQYRPGERGFTFLHIGRFAEVKNHALLLRAFAGVASAHRDARLHLMGDGPLRLPMQDLARELGIAQQVAFLGLKSDVYPYLRDADAFVLPSQYEGVPLTLIEAMGTGLPIIASAVGGVPDMLEHEVSALLIEPAEETLRAAMERLYADEVLRCRLGRAARREAPQFSAAEVARQYEMIYQSR